MSKAFVLVNTKLGSETELQSELKKIEGIVGVHPVYGVYDLVVEVQAESDEKLKDVIFFAATIAVAPWVRGRFNSRRARLRSSPSPSLLFDRSSVDWGIR